MAFCSIIFEHLCAESFWGFLNIKHYNFLESAGIFAFVYIFIFGIFSLFKNTFFDKALEPQAQKIEYIRADKIKRKKYEYLEKSLQHLSQTEKAKLKKELAERLGIDSNIN